MHFKVTLIVIYDLILTLFDNIRICFEIPESVLKFLMNRFFLLLFFFIIIFKQGAHISKEFFNGALRHINSIRGSEKNILAFHKL